MQVIILVLGKHTLKHCGAKGQNDHNLLSNDLKKNVYIQLERKIVQMCQHKKN